MDADFVPGFAVAGSARKFGVTHRNGSVGDGRRPRRDTWFRGEPDGSQKRDRGGSEREPAVPHGGGGLSGERFGGRRRRKKNIFAKFEGTGTTRSRRTRTGVSFGVGRGADRHESRVCCSQPQKRMGGTEWQCATFLVVTTGMHQACFFERLPVERTHQRERGLRRTSRGAAVVVRERLPV